MPRKRPTWCFHHRKSGWHKLDPEWQGRRSHRRRSDALLSSIAEIGSDAPLERNERTTAFRNRDELLECPIIGRIADAGCRRRVDDRFRPKDSRLIPREAPKAATPQHSRNDKHPHCALSLPSFVGSNVTGFEYSTAKSGA